MDDLATLRWLVEAGADEALLETPLDRFSALPPPPSIAAPTPARAAPVAVAKPAAPILAAPQPAAMAEQTARAAAAAAQTLPELKVALAAFEGCSLKATATNLVFADGNPAAPILLVGEAPEAEEDRTGTPFAGEAGALLDRMLAAIGLDRTGVYIIYVVPWRPPASRKPSAADLAVCLPFARRHIALAKPKLLVLVGETSARSLLGTSETLFKLRGRWRDYTDPALPGPIPALTTYSPSYLLNLPAQKRDSWRDLLSIKQKIAEL